jgi:DNA-binding NtrC family response regulator
MRAKRCYEVAKIAPESAHLFCESTCDECEYYRLVQRQRTNVLVVTDDDQLTNNLLRNAGAANFNLEIAECEYTCSLKVADFRADFVIVDCSLGQRTSSGVSRHLVQDPRIPSVRVVLAGTEDEFPEECDKEIFARMERPFGVDEIGKIIDFLEREN